MIDLNNKELLNTHTIFFVNNSEIGLIDILQKYSQAETLKIKSNNNLVVIGNISINTKEMKVCLNNKEIHLALKEYKLLELFMLHPNRIWTRNDLLDKIWGLDFYGDAKTVDVHIAWLRKKLGLSATKSNYLKTIRGVGYRFN